MHSPFLHIFGVSLLTIAIHQAPLLGYCARCAKIESERAQEQALHPVPQSYYNDQLALSETTSSLQPKDLFHEDPADAKTSLAAPSNSSDQHSTLLLALQIQPLFPSTSTHRTLFIPSNEALRAFGNDKLASLVQPASAERLRRIINHHIIDKKITPTDFQKFRSKEIKSLSGANLTLDFKDGTMRIDGAKVLAAYPLGTDGVVYVIDRLLIDDQDLSNVTTHGGLVHSEGILGDEMREKKAM